MVRWRIDEAARVMEGRVISGDPAASFGGAALDSRKIDGGEAFFALAGVYTDGHRFAASAAERGAAVVILERPVELPPGAASIEVGDGTEALHALTRATRERVPRHLLGLTGSAGKTTTKELLAAMLRSRFHTAASPGNLNNLYGFPLALLGIDEDSEWMVAEMGMSTPGEMRGISLLAQPDAVVLLNVRPAHLESFGTLAAIAEAKAESLAGLAEDGLLVANRDDPEVARVATRHRGRIVWFGHGPDAEVRVSRVEALPGRAAGSRFRITAGEDSADFALPLHGGHNVENALAAAAAAWALGVPLADCAASLRGAKAEAGRGEVSRLARGVTVIDDSYNANPDAVLSALESAAEAAGERHWAVLGEMLELGPEAPRFHREIGEAAARLGFEPLGCVGELAREIAAGAGERAQWLADAEAAAAWASDQVREGDLILVKGSRGVALETVVSRLAADHGLDQGPDQGVGQRAGQGAGRRAGRNAGEAH